MSEPEFFSNEYETLQTLTILALSITSHYRVIMVPL